MEEMTFVNAIASTSLQ